MKKVIIIALLICFMASGCDSPFSCNPAEYGVDFIIYKYNTGEQYRDNVMLWTYWGDTIPISKKRRHHFHNGYSHYPYFGADDTINYCILSLTYNEIDTMNEEWKKHYRDYIIPNVRVSEMYRVEICPCKRRDCYYKLFPFCTEDSNNSIKWDFFTIDTTKINQMIDNGTLWQYFNRII